MPEIHAVDVDPDAIRWARRNLPGAALYESDLFAALPNALRRRVDVLAVNAPYVPTGAIGFMSPEAREHEHRIALDGGPDGLDLHRRVIAEASEWLAPGGHLLLECGTDQAPVSAGTDAAGRAGGTDRARRRDRRHRGHRQATTRDRAGHGKTCT